MKLNRDNLIDIREQCKKDKEGCGQDWATAYIMLANAADHLDAMMARCEINEIPHTATERTKLTLKTP